MWNPNIDITLKFVGAQLMVYKSQNKNMFQRDNVSALEMSNIYHLFKALGDFSLTAEYINEHQIPTIVQAVQTGRTPDPVDAELFSWAGLDEST